MVRIVGTELPEWGALPIEAYMIRHWDYQSTEQATEQRLRLVSDFLQIEEIPNEYYDKTNPNFRLATKNEINKILLTWRSDDVRKLAYHIWERQNCSPFLLRAWYENIPAHENKMNRWASIFNKLNQISDCPIIEGRELFMFPQTDEPNHWRTIYAQLPELAGPDIIRNPAWKSTRWDGIPPWYDELIERFKEDIAHNKKTNPRLWKKDPEYLIEACASRIQRACAYQPIILLDKKAFYEGKGLLMFMDQHTNVIRKVRIHMNDPTIITICEDWFEHRVTPWMWQTSEVGDMWKITGEMGEHVYQLTDEDMAPPAGDYLSSEGKMYFTSNEPSGKQRSSTGQTASSTRTTALREHRIVKQLSTRQSSSDQRLPATGHGSAASEFAFTQQAPSSTEQLPPIVERPEI